MDSARSLPPPAGCLGEDSRSVCEVLGETGSDMVSWQVIDMWVNLHVFYLQLLQMNKLDHMRRKQHVHMKYETSSFTDNVSVSSHISFNFSLTSSTPPPL